MHKFLFCCLLCVIPRIGSTSAAVPAALEKGRIRQLSSEIGRLLKLCWRGRNVRLDRDHWAGQTNRAAAGRYQDAVPPNGSSHADSGPGLTGPWELFARLKSAAGYSHSSSSTAGGGDRFTQFGGAGLRAKLTLAGRQFSLSLHEERPPQAILEVCDDGEGLLRIRISGAPGCPDFEMSQGTGGAFRVRDVAAGRDFRAQAESFLAFYRENRQYVGRRLVPLLRQMGVRAPLGHYSGPVKGAVLSRIRASLLADRRARGEELIRLLNDDSYLQRQRATQALSQEFDRYGGLIHLALADPSQPPEASVRLRKIARGHPRRTWIEELITALGLPDDPAYLVELLPEADVHDRAVIAGMLERLTGQRLGQDSDAWLRWLAQQAAQPKAPPK